MRFTEPLQPAILLKRYKRFLADVELTDGTELTVHCPNSGRMTGCAMPGIPVMISRSNNEKRKYPHTLEMVHTENGWVGINTSRTNHLVREALENGRIDDFGVVDRIQAEVKTSAHTRLDFLLECDDKKIYLEVKNCTLAQGKTALFPDAVTARGTKHLHELLALKEGGVEAAVLFCVAMDGVDRFAPAMKIDPLYAETLEYVHGRGVRILVYQARVSPQGIDIFRSLPFFL